MEIGHQPIDSAEIVAWRDEDVRVAGKGADHSVLARSAFEEAQAGGADGDDAPAGSARGIEPVGDVLLDPTPFGVHGMIVGVVGLDRQECPRPHVQSEHFAPYARYVERSDQPGGEMQRRGGRCDRAILGSEQGLVVLAILFVEFALAGNIGRQRHAAGTLQQHLDRLFTGEGQDETAIGQPLLGNGLDPAAELHAVARRQTLGIADEGVPTPQSNALVQGRADPRLAAASL